MALGARRAAVCWLILRRALAQLAIGLAAGTAGAFVLSDLLWGGGMIVVTPRDPATCAATAVVLSVVAMAASLLPARRATRIDPMVALRGGVRGQGGWTIRPPGSSSTSPSHRLRDAGRRDLAWCAGGAGTLNWWGSPAPAGDAPSPRSTWAASSIGRAADS
jgi:hypothetical protein